MKVIHVVGLTVISILIGIPTSLQKVKNEDIYFKHLSETGGPTIKNHQECG